VLLSREMLVFCCTFGIVYVLADTWVQSRQEARPRRRQWWER
jgi:hypothetical protein